MKASQTSSSIPHDEFRHCAEELLFHSSRYYGYTERFLAQLAGAQGFSMAGYDCRRLSENQRKVLTGLMTEPPTPEVGRQIVCIISDVLRGEKKVGRDQLAKYKKRPLFPRRRYFRRRVGEAGACLDGQTSAVDPIQNLARRLHIPVEIKRHEVRMPLGALGTYLDSPNPTIRKNIQDAMLMLHAGGYRLVNTPHLPPKKFDWDGQQGRFSYRLAWRLLCRRLHLH